MESKSLFASRTFWVNALTLVAVIGGQYVPGFEDWLNGETIEEIATGALAVVNIALRLMTSKPVTVTKRKE